MVTLMIEHAISDFATWQGAYDRFAAVRRESGVTREQVYRPVDDPGYVVVMLDFRETGQAERFREFLAERVWASPQSSPALRGTPRTLILRA